MGSVLPLCLLKDAPLPSSGYPLPLHPGLQFLDQIGFTHAGFSDEQDHVRATSQCTLPGHPKPGPLRLAPDQRSSPFQPGRRCSSWRSYSFFCLEQTRVALSDYHARRNTQFAFQYSGTRVIGTQRSSSVPMRYVEAHQMAISCLLKRVGTQQPLSSLDSRGKVLFLLLQNEKVINHGQGLTQLIQ